MAEIMEAARHSSILAQLIPSPTEIGGIARRRKGRDLAAVLMVEFSTIAAISE
jgi:hypothetical protein